MATSAPHRMHGALSLVKVRLLRALGLLLAAPHFPGFTYPHDPALALGEIGELWPRRSMISDDAIEPVLDVWHRWHHLANAADRDRQRHRFAGTFVKVRIVIPWGVGHCVAP